ncbi:MAG: TRAM domain-containing protein [Halobacteriaceae archaeon]
MADCPIADDCPSFTERIEGMGCQYYGDRGGKEWCNHYKQPIEELKTAPVVPGEEVVVDITDLHESGAGIGHTEDGFVVMVDGVLPEARARVKVDTVKPNYARGDVVERLPMEGEEGEEGEQEGSAEDESEETESEAETEGEEESGPGRPPELGSRDNFWGG